MQLVELLRTKFVDGKITITSTELKEMKNDLMQCDEFKETDLIIMDFPVMNRSSEDGDGETISAASQILNKGATFKGISYLYSITLTPEIHNANDLYKPVKDGCSITPTLINPDTFSTFRKIILVSEDIGDRKALHDKLDDILNNQREYTIKGQKSIILRGWLTKNNLGINENEYL